MPISIQGNMSEDAVQDFSGFYEEWFDRVYNYARHRTGSATRADEIVSDTFSRVYQSWARFDPGKGDRRTWLFSIAFRAVADHYRAEKRRSWFSLGLFPEPREPKGSPPEKIEASSDQKRLLAALEALPIQSREIIALKFFSGMTNRAIGGFLGLTESNVAVILFRSIRKMRETLPEMENDHE